MPHACRKHTHIEVLQYNCGKLAHIQQDAYDCSMSEASQHPWWNTRGHGSAVWLFALCDGVLQVLTSWNSIRPQASSDAENAAGKLSFRKSAAAAASLCTSDADT